jgi:hypothetical protein
MFIPKANSSSFNGSTLWSFSHFSFQIWYVSACAGGVLNLEIKVGKRESSTCKLCLGTNNSLKHDIHSGLLCLRKQSISIGASFCPDTCTGYETA